MERFMDNGDGTITDNLTGLMWLKDADRFGKKSWQNAMDEIAKFNTHVIIPGKFGDHYTAEYGDWRLPTINELIALIDSSQHTPALSSGHPFANVQANWYWSSSTYAYLTGYAWDVNMGDGYVDSNYKGNDNYVWPVRR